MRSLDPDRMTVAAASTNVSLFSTLIAGIPRIPNGFDNFSHQPHRCKAPSNRSGPGFADRAGSLSETAGIRHSSHSSPARIQARTIGRRSASDLFPAGKTAAHSQKAFVVKIIAWNSHSMMLNFSISRPGCQKQGD